MSFLDSLMYMPKLEVYLNRGKAYFKKEDLNRIIVRHFRTRLLEKMKKASKFYQEIIEEDERVGPILKQLPNFYFGKDYSKENFAQKMQGKIKLQDLAKISRSHFPPCMVNLFDHLKKEHHLK